MMMEKQESWGHMGAVLLVGFLALFGSAFCVIALGAALLL